jgi:hypothetical protein
MKPLGRWNAYFWSILHPWLFTNVGEAFGQNHDFVARDVVFFSGLCQLFLSLTPFE